MNLRVLSGADVRQAVPMSQAIEAVRKAYIQLSEQQAIVPLRVPLPVEKRDGVSLFMPAYLQESDAMAAKIVSVFPSNTERGLPTIHALVVVIDAETGRPAAILDGTYLTALRTGAASGIATDLLARTDAHTVAIFGAGAQGRTQLQAVSTVRPITRVLVFDPNPDAAALFAAEMAQFGPPIPSDIAVAPSADKAVNQADIVCTATTATKPVFEDQSLKPGTHINGIGSYTPQMQEIPAATIARALIVVDSRSAALAEAGDLIVPIQEGAISEASIHGEIGEVASGRISGRSRKDEITVFKSVGNAAQDVAVAELALHRALELDLGTEVTL